MKTAPVPNIPRVRSRVRFKNILFATDFGTASLSAQANAILLSKMFGSHLFVLHVDEGPGMSGLEHASWVGKDTRQMTDMDFRKMQSVFAGAGVPFTFLLERGEVRETLERVADENDIDLIILGTHARHGFSYLLFGSIAESLGRSSTRPVITVGPNVKGGFERPIRTILYATDFSDESKLALPYATSLAQECRADLTIFHSAPAAESLVRNLVHVEGCLLNRLKSLAPASNFPWCGVKHVVGYGETAAVIIRQATEEEADLIILGLHNSVRFTSHLPERLAYRILCEAPCPVLSVLPSATELTAAQLPSQFLKKAAAFN